MRYGMLTLALIVAAGAFCFAEEVEMAPTQDHKARLSAVLARDASATVIIGKVLDHRRTPGDYKGFWYSVCRLDVEAVPVGEAAGETVGGLLYNWNADEMNRSTFPVGQRILLVVRPIPDEEKAETANKLGLENPSEAPTLRPLGTLGWVWPIEERTSVEEVVAYVETVVAYHRNLGDLKERPRLAAKLVESITSSCLAVRCDLAREIASNPYLQQDIRTLKLLPSLASQMENPQEHPFNRVRYAGVLIDSEQWRQPSLEVLFSILSNPNQSKKVDPILFFYYSVYRPILSIIEKDGDPATADRLFSTWTSSEYRFPEDYNSFPFWDALVRSGSGRGLELARKFLCDETATPQWLADTKDEPRTLRTLAGSLARLNSREAVRALVVASEISKEREEMVKWALDAFRGSTESHLRRIAADSADETTAKKAKRLLETHDDE